MVNHDGFRKFVEDKLNTKVDVSALEEERERIRKLLRQVMGAKSKLTDMLDKLDVMDKHYDRKYQDMHDRLDNLYDKISEYEDSIADITAKIEAVYGNSVAQRKNSRDGYTSRAKTLILGGFGGFLAGNGVVFLRMARWISFRR